MTQAAVRGYQGDDIGQPYRLAACLKHFAGYGAAEGGRDYNTTEISTYQLENFYLPAYRAAVDAGCKLVMSAFNALNGVPCTANRAPVSYTHLDVYKRQGRRTQQHRHHRRRHRFCADDDS